MAETQVENVQLRQEVLRLTDEGQQLRKELESVNLKNCSQVQTLIGEHQDKGAFKIIPSSRAHITASLNVDHRSYRLQI